MFKIVKYNKGKLLPLFEKQTFSESLQAIKYWFDVKRNDQSAQLLIIDDEDKILEHYVIDSTFVEDTKEFNRLIEIYKYYETTN